MSLAIGLAIGLAKKLAKDLARRTRSKIHASSARAERKEIKRSRGRAVVLSWRRSNGKDDDSNSLSHPLSCRHEINSFYRSIPICGHSPFMAFFACLVFVRALAANASSESAVLSVLSTYSIFAMLPGLRIDSPRAASSLESAAYLR